MTQNVLKNWNKMAVNRRRKATDPKFPNVRTVLRDGEWSGRPCVLLGGGPSLSHVLDRVKEFPDGTLIAAANQSWKVDPVPSLVYVIDKQVLILAEEKHRERWNECASSQIRVTNRPNAAAGDWASTYWVDQISGDEWGTSFDSGIVAANNTGLGLLNVVDILRADPIILLGYDAKSEGEKINWHDDYPDKPGWKPKPPERCFSRWRTLMQRVSPQIRSKVYNANPRSSYETFEKITFEEAIEKCKPSNYSRV